MDQYANGPQLPFTGASTWELVALIIFALVAVTIGLLVRYNAR